MGILHNTDKHSEMSVCVHTGHNCSYFQMKMTFDHQYISLSPIHYLTTYKITEMISLSRNYAGMSDHF